MNQIRNLSLMSQDPEGALCSHLTLIDLTSPKFLMDYRLVHCWSFCSSVARKWKNTGYLFQTSEKQPEEPFETACRLHLSSQSQGFRKQQQASRRENTDQIHSILLKPVPSVITQQRLEHCCAG